MNPTNNHPAHQLSNSVARTTPTRTQSEPATAPSSEKPRGDHLDSVDDRRSQRADCVILNPQPATAKALDPRDALTPAGTVSRAVSGVREIFEQLRPVLAPGGVVWLDVAEPATAAGADVTGLAWRMVLAVQADGWTLRNAITCTTAPDPRPTACPSSETGVRTLFLLTRERHYYFALPPREASTRWPTPARESGERRPRAAGCRPQLRASSADRHSPPAVAGVRGSAGGSGALSGALRNPGDVWSLPHNPDRLEGCSCGPAERPGPRDVGSVAAAVAVASRAIALGCPPGGLVHDPLAICAHGPVARAARHLGRQFQPGARRGSTAISAVAAGPRSRSGINR
jgi:site-specific DNA-methyltransferase (cytosine-N4-specific)